MSQTGTSAWWTEVQHLRGAAERTDEARRRADQADLAARRASRERHSIEAEVASIPSGSSGAVAPAPAPDVAAPRRPEPDGSGSPRGREYADSAAAPGRREYADSAAAPGRRERDNGAAAPGRRERDNGAAAPGRREHDNAPAPRRREHVDNAAAARRRDTPPVARRGGYGDAVARRGGYGDAVAIPGRRTIEIRGRTVPAPAVPPSLELDRMRRPPRRAVERIGPRPDRLAMWALVMGLLLIAVAITTASPT